MALTPEERTLRARIAAYSLHAQGKTTTKAAKAAYDSRWAKLVDPDGILPPVERERRAEAARRAHYSRMAFESAKRRRRSAAIRRSPKSIAGDRLSRDDLELADPHPVRSENPTRDCDQPHDSVTAR